MAARKWSIKSYNAYLSAAKTSYGLSHRQAQQMYRNHTQRAGQGLRAKDLRDHPRIAAQEARRASQRPKTAIPPGGRPGQGRGGARAAGAGAGAGRIPEEFDGIEDFFYDGYQSDEEQEY